MEEKQKKGGNILLKAFAWVAGIIFAIIILVPCLLYVPFVQEAVKNGVSSYINKNMAMTVDVERILLEFPLRLNVENALVLDEHEDTMVYAKSLLVDVEFMPLLKNKVDLQKAELIQGVYNMVSADSSMVLKARLAKFVIDQAHVSLDSSEVNLGGIALEGGKVSILIDNNKSTKSLEDTTSTAGWKINTKNIKLENLDYEMQMLPMIDNLYAHVGLASLSGGVIDTGNLYVSVGALGLDSVDVKYIYPTPEYIAAYPMKADSLQFVTPEDTAIWTIRADELRLNGSHVIYAMKNTSPNKGLDMNYIEVSDVNIGIDDFYNSGTNLSAKLSALTAKERSGLQVTYGKGDFSMDDTKIVAKGVSLETMQSKLSLDAEMGSDVATNADSPLSLKLEASVGVGEVGKLYPSMGYIINNIPQHSPVRMSLDLEGTTRMLDLDKAEMVLPQYLAVKAKGRLGNVTDVRHMTANVNFAGNLKNLNFAKPIMLNDTAMRNMIEFPGMLLDGSVNYTPTMAKGNIDLKLEETGKAVFSGDWNDKTQNYVADIKLDSFPLNIILPTIPVENLTVSAHLQGFGYDIYDLSTLLEANVIVDEITYNGWYYSDISAFANFENGYMSMDLESDNSNCEMEMSVNCMLNKDFYEFGLNGNIGFIDLQELQLSKTESRGNGRILAGGTIDLETNSYEMDFNIKDFKWTLAGEVYSTPAIVVSVISSRDSMALYAQEDDDFHINFNTPTSLDTMLSRLTKLQKIMEYEVAEKYLDVDTLQRTLPPMVCELRIGKNNLVQQALKYNGIKMKNLMLDLINDSTIYMNGKIHGLYLNPALQADTLTLYANQTNKCLSYNMHVGNRPGTNDELAQVTIRGGVRGNALGMLLEQNNIRGEQGFKIGMNAYLSDTVIDVKFFPKNPTIGYKEWTMNEGNVVAYDYIDKHFDADLSLRCDSSFIKLYTEHSHDGHNQEDVMLKVGGVQISDWLKLSPLAPPISGEFSADVKMKFDGENIWGGGISRMKNFKYNRKKVGDFDFMASVELDPASNTMNLRSAFDVDGRRTIEAKGMLNDSTSRSPYNLDVTVDSFPLRMANSFIPGNMAYLRGAINGELNVVGTVGDPIVNGFLQCDDAEVAMPLFGSYLSISDNKVPVDSSLIKLNGFKIYGSNNNSINVDGYVYLLPLENPKLNVKMKGSNIEFVNSKQRRNMEVFGKGYANVDATMKGDMQNIDMDVSLTLLPTTNITYVMQTDVAAISTQTDENMVKFVNFADTVEVEEDSIQTSISSSNYTLKAKLNIQQGSKLNVYLSDNGTDRVAIEGSGLLDYYQSSLGDMRLTGQYTIGSGYVRYTPPLLSEKLFNFSDGSYVSWTGNMMNPTLNLKATESMKATVTQEGQDSRLVNFLIDLSVTNTLNNMNVEFDLNTNDDLTVQNEIQSMSPSQRSSQAINLLLYSTYMGLGSSSSSSMSGNPLYSFLNSQINRWAASTIKGVDLTLGVNQYDETKGDTKSKSTTYSYKVSKSFFNDRFKVEVGGNYNPNADAEESMANSLLNDLSFIYMLNQSGSMSVKLFRHTGYESVLEGEVTETGGAFVMKRKLSTLRNLFRFSRRQRTQKPEETRDTIINLDSVVKQELKSGEK